MKFANFQKSNHKRWHTWNWMKQCFKRHNFITFLIWKKKQLAFFIYYFQSYKQATNITSCFLCFKQLIHFVLLMHLIMLQLHGSAWKVSNWWQAVCFHTLDYKTYSFWKRAFFVILQLMVKKGVAHWKFK